jgi:hypothetical protein
MKPFAFVPIVLSLYASDVVAQTNSRDAIIEKIESAYTRTTMFSAESPVVKNMLAPAMTTNPGVSTEVWTGIAKEVALALSKVMTEKGGLMDTFLRGSLEPLSEAELKRLETLLTDPVYLKFQAGMGSPSTQRQFVQAIMSNTERMGIAINEVLVKHGLKKIH